MKTWLESIYSDGSGRFVSSPKPALGEEVLVRIRFYEDAPVKAVVLRCMPNGQNIWLDLWEEKREQGFVYYACNMPMWESRMHYHFCLVTEEGIYYYNQRGVHTRIPDHSYDFVLLCDYDQPEWVKRAVFYQIFPERFCNGDEGNDVQSGELVVNGYPSIRMDWDSDPLEWEQGHCMDFFGGDLKGIQDKIPYLKELGVTALYLNPIFEAPSVHKYDCIDYFHVDRHFGGDEALAELSAALHENGMKLILDISINHTGAAHRWFNRDGLYFDKSEGAFNNPDAPERKFYFFHQGNTYTEWKGVHDLPTLNYTSEELRDIIYRRPDSVLRKWLRPPYSIDGWRFDVADVFARNGEFQLAHELWPEIRRAIREENPEAYILAEDWGDCAQYLQGGEWDSPMNYFGFGRPVRQLLGENDWFQNDSPTLRGCKFRLSAEDFEGRVLDHLGRMPFALQENQFNLFDSHDIARLSSDESVPFDHWRGAVCLQFAMPGCPSIYYGDETDIGGWFHSMEGCRFPMPWGRDFTGTEAYRMIRTLAKLKTSREALQTGSFKFLYAKDRTVAISRFTEQEAFVAVLSTEEQEQTVILPLGAVGASGIKGDVLGHTVRWTKLDENHVTLTLNPGEGLFLELEMKD